MKRATHPDFIFLTGDLGFMALEPLQKVAGKRFINAGLAEQNMVSVAAGLASQGLRPWAYSIAPFIYARPLEQIRNDVCLHDFPVTLVGNGGGYGYGVMGGSHHAIEDYGILLSLQNMRVWVPAFGADVESAVARILEQAHPAYLRLGRDEKPIEFDPGAYAPWRKVLSGGGSAMVVVGPIAGVLMKDFAGLENSKRPNLWVLTELPLEEKTVPGQFLKDIETSGHLAVVEEHVAHGSAGEMIARFLLLSGRPPKKFSHFCAQGYLSGYYGSQSFHHKECGITSENILKVISAE